MERSTRLLLPTLASRWILTSQRPYQARKNPATINRPPEMRFTYGSTLRMLAATDVRAIAMAMVRVRMTRLIPTA